MAKSEKNFIKIAKDDGSMGFVLFMAWMGALVYFIQQSEGFWGFILAILKAIVWPAFLVHRAFEALGI